VSPNFIFYQQVCKVVQSLCQIWAAMGQVYSQLAFLAAQWPLSLHYLSLDMMRAEVQILFRSVKAKARVIFLFDSEVLTRWPLTVRQLRFEVQTVYGELK
jgi:kinetochore protein Spc7/SPC105